MAECQISQFKNYNQLLMAIGYWDFDLYCHERINRKILKLINQQHKLRDSSFSWFNKKRINQIGKEIRLLHEEKHKLERKIQGLDNDI
jgi:hypothetical protein